MLVTRKTSQTQKFFLTTILFSVPFFLCNNVLRFLGSCSVTGSKTNRFRLGTNCVFACFACLPFRYHSKILVIDLKKSSLNQIFIISVILSSHYPICIFHIICNHSIYVFDVKWGHDYLQLQVICLKLCIDCVLLNRIVCMVLKTLSRFSSHQAQGVLCKPVYFYFFFSQHTVNSILMQ